MTALVSWLEELERREAAAREKICELRAQIEELAGHLAEQEMVLSRLEITRETMTEILSGEETVSESGSVAEPEAGGPVEVSRPGRERRAPSSGCSWCRRGRPAGRGGAAAFVPASAYA